MDTGSARVPHARKLHARSPSSKYSLAPQQCAPQQLAPQQLAPQQRCSTSATHHANASSCKRLDMASDDMSRYFATPRLNMSRFASTPAEARAWSDSKLQGNVPFFASPASRSTLPVSPRSAFASLGGVFGGASEVLMHGGVDGSGMEGMAVDNGPRTTGGLGGIDRGASPAFAQLLVGIQEFTHDALEEPMMGIQVIRIHTTFGQLPMVYLVGLLNRRCQYSVREVQLCVQSSLRPCLQEIDEDAGLAFRLTALSHRFLSASLNLKWHFLRSTVQVGVGLLRHPFHNFVEKDMVKAIEALREHGHELSEILGEESNVRPAKTPTVSTHKRGLSHSSAMEIDELL